MNNRSAIRRLQLTTMALRRHNDILKLNFQQRGEAGLRRQIQDHPQGGAVSARQHYRDQYLSARARGDKEGMALALKEFAMAFGTDKATQSAGLRRRIDDELGIPESEQLPSSEDLKSESPISCNWAESGRYSIVIPRVRKG